MSEIIIETDGADAVRETLSEVAGRMKNLSPILKTIGERVVSQTKDRFRDQGPAPSGAPWAPLKPSTLRRKKHSKILTESTDLRGSIHFQLRGNNIVVIGTGAAIYYAAIHQLGGEIKQGARSDLFTRNRYVRGEKKGQFKKGTKSGRGMTFGDRIIRIPARPYLGLSEANSEEINDIISDYIVGR